MKQYMAIEIDAIKDDILKKLSKQGMKNVTIDCIEVVPLLGGSYIAQYLVRKELSNN